MDSAELRKTKKIKSQKKNADAWNLFDNEIGEQKMECIYSSDIGNKEICTICKSALSYTDEGFLGCTNNKCGIIYTDMIELGAEWRYYGADDNSNSDPTRCGMPINPLLAESSFGCKILGGTGGKSWEMRKIKRYTEWQSMPYREKAQWDEFQQITVHANNYNIPKIIIDSAIRYHKQISEEKTFRGLNREGIIAASIYISCSVNKYPRTAKEIAQIFNLDNTSATKGCKNAMSIINSIESNHENNDKTILTHATPTIFIDRFCSNLNINDELTRLCKFIAKKVQQKKLIPENTPPSIAVGIIYFVCQKCNLNITKKSIYAVTQVSEVTINKCSQKLLPYEETLIPNVILKKYSS
jgi:transcription initiation factor TFIIB